MTTRARTHTQMGDRTNFVLMFAGELLKKAEYLLTMGLHPSEIVSGYEMARDKCEAELKGEEESSFDRLSDTAGLWAGICQAR